MNSPLNGLSDPLPTDQPSPTDFSPGVQVPAPNNFAAAAKNPDAHAPLAVLKAVIGGQLPGVLIPHDAPKIQSSLTPQDLLQSGVGLYRPKSPGIAAVLFNPQHVPVSTLKAMDSKGTLKKAFPPITKFLGASKGKAAPKSSKVSNQAPGPSDSPSAISETNLTGSPAPATVNMVPILPKPSFSADAEKQLAMKRVNAIAGNTLPSNRPMPGSGSVLQGLTQSVI